jgi:hypothetical protein
LKRLIEDGMILLAYDRARDKTPGPITEYFLSAIETVRANKQRYAEAEANARRQHPSRPSFFDVMSAFGVPGAE